MDADRAAADSRRGLPAEPCARPARGALLPTAAAPGAADREGLIDPFGRRITYLRLSIIESCNLACTYCRPAGETGVAALPPRMRRAEIVRLARLFVSMGVEKVRLTGGEPTLHADLLPIVSDLAALPRPPRLALTTNGVLLPRLARELRAAGLARVNISLDAVSPAVFERLTGRNRYDAVRAGLAAALAGGFERVKVNAVILRGVNEDQILPLALLARDQPVDVRFIEYMPVGGSSGDHRQRLPAEEVERRLSKTLSLRRAEKELGDGPARLVEVDGFRGRLGFISPYSVPFCTDCNRVRVTSRGTLRLCLLGGGEADLLGPLTRGAGDEELARLVRQALSGKAERHPFVEAGLEGLPCGEPAAGLPMWAVGG